jgi:hypothetical protein
MGVNAPASEKMATVSMPTRLHVRITRQAISPRLAMSTLLRVLRLLDAMV